MMGIALSIAHDGIAKDLEGEGTLESRVAIEAFLREVETRAFRIALMNVRDRDEALATFMREIVGMPEPDLADFRANPIWPRRAAAVFVAAGSVGDGVATVGEMYVTCVG